MLSVFFIDNSLNKRIGNINYRYIPVFLRINKTGEHNSLSCHRWTTHILLCDENLLLVTTDYKPSASWSTHANALACMNRANGAASFLLLWRTQLLGPTS